MKEIKVKFDKQVSLSEFDKQILKLVDNFRSDISVLIKVVVKYNFIEAILKENPNKLAVERWEWDLNDIANSNFSDYSETIN